MDSSGKETQTSLLFERMRDRMCRVEFPNYKSEASALVRMYLNGEFSDNPDGVDPYTASMFFACDRYASYVTEEWGEIYRGGGVVLADRYTTSNMIHQGCKFDDKDKRDEYLKWLYDLEYIKSGLPVPDLVIFLDLPLDNVKETICRRQNKITGGGADIHERNYEYLRKAYNTAAELAAIYGWQRVDCLRDGEYRTRDDIAEEIYNIVTGCVL